MQKSIDVGKWNSGVGALFHKEEMPDVVGSGVAKGLPKLLVALKDVELRLRV